MIRMGNWFAKINDDKAFEEYMKTADDLMAVMAAADARPTPPPLSATDRLQRNLERTVTESTARAETLRQEIAAREAELADVMRAEEAARMGLEALDDRITEEGDGPDEPVMAWPFGRAGVFSPITDEDLSAACGLALEAEMRTPRVSYSGLVFDKEDSPGYPFHFTLDKGADLAAYLEAKRVEFGAHAIAVTEDGK